MCVPCKPSHQGAPYLPAPPNLCIKAGFCIASLVAAAEVSHVSHRDELTPSLCTDLNRPVRLLKVWSGPQCYGSRENAHRPNQKPERSAMLGSAAKLREAVSQLIFVCE